MLLGRYNSQDLGNDYQVLLRVTEGETTCRTYNHNWVQSGFHLPGAVGGEQREFKQTFDHNVFL